MSTLPALIAGGIWLLVEAIRQYRAWRIVWQQVAAQSPVSVDFSDIDVLQPIRSGDPALARLLTQNLQQLGGHGAHLHWLLDADDTPARQIAQAIRHAHPELSEQLHISTYPACPEHINPKLFKLDRALPNCRGRYLLVLDDDAILPVASLAALRRSLVLDRPNAATSLPVYITAAGASLGTRLLARFVNDQATLTYLATLRAPGALSLNGMSWLIPRQALQDIGGFAPQLGHLTDDLAMAELVRAAGGSIAQRHEPVYLTTSLSSLAHYRAQMQRWMLFALLLIRRQPRLKQLQLGLELGVPLLLPGLFLLTLIVGFSPPATALGGLAFLLQIYGRWRLQSACASQAARPQPVLSMISALLLPLHLLHARINPRITWRHRRYYVRASDVFEEIQDA